jgi:hypothetical protein
MGSFFGRKGSFSRPKCYPYPRMGFVERDNEGEILRMYAEGEISQYSIQHVL